MSGSNQHYINPSGCCKSPLITAKMPATYQRGFLQKLRVILFFIMICRQKRTHLNTGPPPALDTAPSPQPQPPPRRQRKPPNPWVMLWVFHREERGCYRMLLAELILTDIPGYQIFVRMPPAFFSSLRNAYTTASRSQSPISGSP